MQVPGVGDDHLAHGRRLIDVACLHAGSRQDGVALRPGTAMTCLAELHRAQCALPGMIRCDEASGRQIAEGPSSMPQQAALIEIQPVRVTVI